MSLSSPAEAAVVERPSKPSLKLSASVLSPVHPTTALDFALQALAAGNAERALRWAIPALGTSGAGAVACDLVSRALLALDARDAAVDALNFAVTGLLRHGLASHAIAAALALESLQPGSDVLERVAAAVGANSPARNAPPSPPPPLRVAEIRPLDRTCTREDLVWRAITRLADLSFDSPAPPLARRAPLWSDLPDDLFVRLARAAVPRIVGAGATLTTAGGKLTGAFLVIRGEVHLSRRVGPSREPTRVAVLGPGALVGEASLLGGTQSWTDATAVYGALVLELDRAAVEGAMVTAPALRRPLRAYAERRLVESVLASWPLLAELPSNEREHAATLFAVRPYRRGDAIVTPGAQPAGLYVLASGDAEIRRADSAAAIGPGSLVGAASVLLRRPATEAVVATSPSLALELARDRVAALARSCPHLLAALYEAAIEADPG